MPDTTYQRIVIKLSGRAFAGESSFGLDIEAFDHVATEVAKVVDLGVQVAIVVGGGNFFRGNTALDWNIDQAEADNVGMLGTAMNAIILRGTLVGRGLTDVRLMTALPIPSMAEPFIRLRALNHLSHGRIVLLGCGNGQPFVTTDYPAAQRAVELNADAILVAKHGTDGIYERDPQRDPTAKRFATLSYKDVLERDLKVMDQSAIVLARDHDVPLHVFDFEAEGAMADLCSGGHRGTFVSTSSSMTLAEVG
jgi:uridylate kinase